MTDNEILQIAYECNIELFECEAGVVGGVTEDQILKFARRMLSETGKDAQRYAWLKSRKNLTLQSARNSVWFKPNGESFVAPYYLAEGGAQHAPMPSLDEAIDAAMRVDTGKEKRRFCGIGELERNGYIPAGSVDERAEGGGKK